MPSFSELVGEFGVRPLYRMLGFFSIIGLLRVHVLLGDFTLALKVMENVELNQKVLSVSYIRRLFPSNAGLVTIHARHRLPCYDVLLRRVLLHHAPSLPRRHSRVRLDTELYTPHEAIPHPELPIRPGMSS